MFLLRRTKARLRSVDGVLCLEFPDAAVVRRGVYPAFASPAALTTFAPAAWLHRDGTTVTREHPGDVAVPLASTVTLTRKHGAGRTTDASGRVRLPHRARGSHGPTLGLRDHPAFPLEWSYVGTLRATTDGDTDIARHAPDVVLSIEPYGLADDAVAEPLYALCRLTRGRPWRTTLWDRRVETLVVVAGVLTVASFAWAGVQPLWVPVLGVALMWLGASRRWMVGE